MENIRTFLSIPLFVIDEQQITVAQLLLVPVVLIAGFFLAARLKKTLIHKLAERKFDQDLVLLIDRLFMITAMALLVLFSLSLLNVPLTAFAFISGAIAIGLGFGAQNIINNFISGWILMWERPIRIGDFLEIGDVKGKVETISTRSTRIRRVDGVHILIPNSHLLENMVVNWTLIDDLTRAQVRVGVAYGSPARKVSELLTQAALGHGDVLKDPEPLVLFEDFGDNALIFDLFFWVHSKAEKGVRVVCSELRFAIDELFAQHGLVIAYPQRDVHLDGELKLVQPPVVES